MREEDIATGLSYLKQDLQAQGYWTAEAVIGQRETERSGGAVNFTLRVTPGPLYHIARATVSSKETPAVGLVTGDGADFPIDLRYFNGGARSVRSFPERELGPSAGAGNYPTGGDAYWASNLELIRQLAGPVKLVGFLDAGSRSQKYSDIAAADVELAAGLGLRLDLPIGPVRLEYGFNLTQRPGDPTGTFHFAIGAAF